MEYLSQKECEIIVKLRTEYINLNQYLHHIKYHSDGQCRHCKVQETVSHFLIDCVGFKDSMHLHGKGIQRKIKIIGKILIKI